MTINIDRLIKQLTILFTLFTITFTTWGQISVTGKVIAIDGKYPIPGVNVVEKGLPNGTTTQSDGTFVLDVTDPNAILVFSFIGMVTQEHPINGQREVFIKAKWDCNKDFFDSQTVMIYANSGVINSPIGGQINFATPWVLGGLVKLLYGYQTNLKNNEYQRAQVEMAHYISNCDFDIDFRWSFRQVSFGNDLNSNANSFESDLNLRNVKLIVGYSRLLVSKRETNSDETFTGGVIGFGTQFRIALNPAIIAKVGVYKGEVEYQAEIQGGHKRLLCSIRFYKFDDFNELSLGIGAWIGYRLKRRNVF